VRVITRAITKSDIINLTTPLLFAQRSDVTGGSKVMWDFRRILFWRRYRRPTTTARLGKEGEVIAKAHLAKNGYRIVAAGFTAPIKRANSGRVISAEIDLIAWDESTAPSTLAFIEVKTRTSANLALPEAAVNRRKQRQISRAARVFKRMIRVEGEQTRYDVVSLLVAQDREPENRLIKGYFKE